MYSYINILFSTYFSCLVSFCISSVKRQPVWLIHLLYSRHSLYRLYQFVSTRVEPLTFRWTSISADRLPYPCRTDIVTATRVNKNNSLKERIFSVNVKRSVLVSLSAYLPFLTSAIVVHDKVNNYCFQCKDIKMFIEHAPTYNNEINRKPLK